MGRRGQLGEFGGGLGAGRVAVASFEISHFEVPLFRLIAGMPDTQLRVFYLASSKSGRYDGEYRAAVQWGVDLDALDYAVHVESPREMRAKIFGFNPDVILLYGYTWPGALRILAEARFRGILIVHRGTLSTKFVPNKARGAAFKRRVRNQILRLFSRHHFGGIVSKQALLEAKVPESAMYWVPYSVDCAHFVCAADSAESALRADEIISTAGWSLSDPVVLFVGYHGWIKGPDIAIRAYLLARSRVPNLKMLFVGSGTMTEDVRTVALEASCGNSVVFTGFIPSYATVPYYLASDLVLFTSRYETWGRSINEAMLCKRPCVVGSHLPPAHDLVIDKVSGAVVEMLSPEAFADAVVGMLEMGVSRLHEIGEVARQHALRFAYENHIEALAASLRQPSDCGVAVRGGA
jgi:glycosyltransferase involved in cell wall biosynthesis